MLQPVDIGNLPADLLGPDSNFPYLGYLSSFFFFCTYKAVFLQFPW